jgi:hypothetical protein
MSIKTKVSTEINSGILARVSAVVYYITGVEVK